jgi:hypothetical protein
MPVLAALFAGLLLAGCASAGPTVETSDVFEAAPWRPGEALHYQVVNTAGDIIGTGLLEAAADGGRIALHQRYVELDPPEGMPPTSDDTTVWVNASTFRPERGERVIVRRASDGTLSEERWEWRYEQRDGEPVLVSTHTDRDRDPDERTLRLRAHYYDNESSLWLWRSVDLIEEHEAYYVSANPIERSQQTVHLRVPQVEQVTVPAGEFEAYRLLFRTGRAVRTAWIEMDPPHRVLKWDNGDVILELLP